MKPLSTAGHARAAASAQRPLWLLELAPAEAEAGDLWVYRAATRAVTLDDEPWPAHLAAPPAWSEQLDDPAQWPGGLARAQAELHLLEPPPSGEPTAALRDQLAQRPPLTLRATLRLAWLDAQDNAQPEDAVTLLRGHVAAWDVEPTGIVLRLQDELQSLAPRPVGRLLRAAMLSDSGLHPMIGEPLPWVFGRHADLELPVLRTGATSRLRYPITLISGRIPLPSLDGFPTHGLVQVGAELVEYTAVDTINKTLGTSWSGVTRGVAGSVAVEHATGTQVRAVPPGGFQWFLADHPCRVVESVRADDLPMDGWVVEQPLLGPHTATVLTRAAWPVTPEGRFATSITATCEGHMNADGTLAANPIDVLRLLLTHPRLGGLDAARLDGPAFTAARTRLAASDYRYQRRVGGRQTLGELLRGAAREAGLWLGCGDPIAPLSWDPAPHGDEVQLALTRAVAFAAEASARLHPPAGGRVPDAVELVGPAAGPGLEPVAWQFPPESLASGVLPHRAGISWLDLHQPAAAADLGELLWWHLGDTPFVLRQSFAPGLARLRPGETVRLEDAALDLPDALAWLTALDFDPQRPERLTATLRGPWVNAWCWRADAESPHLNHIRQLAFGARMQIVLEGRPVALLTRGGHLRLRGRLREAATFAAGPFAQHFTLGADGWLYFSLPTPGGYLPFLRIDAAGDVEMHGTLRERSAFAFTTPGTCHGVSAGGLWLSPDNHTPAFEYEAATQRLHLPGTLIEAARL